VRDDDRVPDEDAYSRMSDPQRYVTLSRRARLLVPRLTSIFDVRVDDVSAGLGRFAEGVEVIRFVPADERASTLTLGLTDAAVYLGAGHAYLAAFPDCGCDACDADPDEVFAELESTVYAVTRGRLRESASGGWYEATLLRPRGRSTGGGLADDFALRDGDGEWHWAPWPDKDRHPGATASFAPIDGFLAAEDVVREHIDAFNDHSTSRLLAWFAPEAVWQTGTDRLVGIDALAELFDDGLWAMEPALEIRSCVASFEGRVALELTETLTIEGRRTAFAIAGFFTVEDGRITEAKIYREGSAEL
jgi:hypothetical protein